MSYSRLVRPEFQCFLTSPYYLYAPVLKFIQGNLRFITLHVKSQAAGTACVSNLTSQNSCNCVARCYNQTL
jgi:hypothetical protein